VPTLHTRNKTLSNRKYEEHFTSNGLYAMKKILVIDDTDFIREDIATTLQFEGYITVTAEDGLAGVEKARAEKPDLILCDVSMPRLDGFGALEQIRATPELKTTPFIFLTAKAEKPDQRRGMELGANDYLTKPFTTDELIAAVKTQLDKVEDIHDFIGDELIKVFENIIYALPHEFRTPLNGLLGLSNVLVEMMQAIKAGEQMNIEDIEMLSLSIRDSAKRLHHLAENFLVFTQIQALAANEEEKRALQKQRTVGLASTISDIAESQAIALGRTDDVTVDVEETDLAISVHHFCKIVDELMSNALKFSDAGSRIEVKGQVAHGLWHVEITDYGRGMKPEDLKLIGPFNQFERKKHEQQGAGLGLAIVKKLVELYNGNFHIESELEHFTKVYVDLPIAPPLEE
jgi:signal transduction histidine kinase